MYQASIWCPKGVGLKIVTKQIVVDWLLFCNLNMVSGQSSIILLESRWTYFYLICMDIH